MAYRCRAYPDDAQQRVLARTFGCVRAVWNRTLAARQERYASKRKATSCAETDRCCCRSCRWCRRCWPWS
ncbi:MAG TPA: helix-turn-helix domain-containing protein [Streptosporangiaceae bacterium]